MRNWCLLQCQVQNFQRITTRIHMLNIESFVPTEVKISRRRDCNGCRTTEKPLFPGYIFLRFDPEEIHTTTFTEIPGARHFVSFGGQPETVSDTIIAALKCSAHLLIYPEDNAVGFKNLPPELIEKISLIFSTKNALERQISFFKLLESDNDIELMTRNGGRIYSQVPSNQPQIRPSV